MGRTHLPGFRNRHEREDSLSKRHLMALPPDTSGVSDDLRPYFERCSRNGHCGEYADWKREKRR
jgi:hypothetical protein